MKKDIVQMFEMPSFEMPSDNSELSAIGFNKKFNATIDYEVVGESENSVTLKINNIAFKRNKRIE